MAIPGSTMNVFSKLTGEIFVNIKYIDINYPPNVISIFGKKKASLTLIPEAELMNDDPLDTELPSIFYKWEISKYIVNNMGVTESTKLLL